MLLANRFQFLPSTGVALGLMLSPDVLSRLGNSIGTVGFSFLAVLLVAGLVYISTTLSYGVLDALHPGPCSEIQSIKAVFGSHAAMVLPICSRIGFTIFGSAGILVTAGFAFNEIFVSWFPNFAFAFLLLGVLMTINLFGYRISMSLQILFVALSLSGLIFLSVSGLVGTGNVQTNPSQVLPEFQFGAVFPGLMMLVGFDLSIYISRIDSEGSLSPLKAMITAIIIAVLVYCLWGAASLIHVLPAKLAETSIPHTIAARRIMGQNGRILIGLAVLAGTCGAVNALFMSVAAMTGALTELGLLPNILFRGGRHRPVPLIILASGIALVMGSGLTGKPVLETYIRASLIFWIINYGAVHMAALTLNKRRNTENQAGRYHNWLIGVGFIALSCGIIGLLWTNAEPLNLIKYMLIVFTIVFLVSFAWIYFNRNKIQYSP